MKEKKMEVFDLESDVVVYDVKNKEILSKASLITKDAFETFPAFSPMVNGFISVRPRPRRCRRIMIRYVIISAVSRSIRIVARSASRSIRWYMRIA